MKKEELLRFYLKYRLYIFPVVAAVVSFILIITVIYPQAIKLFTNQKVQDEISKRANFLTAKAQDLESYDPLDLDSKVSFVLNSYPAQKDYSSVIGILQNLTAQAGFSIVSMSISADGLQDMQQGYNIKLDILGPAKFLPILINNIENSPRLMRVASLESSVGRDAESAMVTININILYSPVPEGYGSVDSTVPELSEKDQEVLGTLASSGSYFNQPVATSSAATVGKPNPFE